jgi:hypothetical protein
VLKKKKPLLRTATQADVARLVAPLWLLVNGCDWGKPAPFEHLKCAVLALVSQLAYCSPTEEEKENPHRARLVPCMLYQMLIGAQTIDLKATVANADFQNVGLVETRRFSALIIPASGRIFIGIRGTQFAYDWLINLAATKRSARLGNGSARLHSGFLSEARELADRLTEHLEKLGPTREYQPTSSIYLGGHSLGGAIAAILYSMPWAPPPFTVEGCYIFGAPRIASASTMNDLRQPFATRRPLDIVPCVPPTFIGYANFEHQIHTNGAAYTVDDRPAFPSFAQWIIARAVKRFPRNHSMDRYCHEILLKASEHPNVQPLWKYDDITESLRDLELFE